MKVDKKIIKRQKVQKIWDFNCSKTILILLLFDNALVQRFSTGVPRNPRVPQTIIKGSAKKMR